MSIFTTFMKFGIGFVIGYIAAGLLIMTDNYNGELNDYDFDDFNRE